MEVSKGISKEYVQKKSADAFMKQVSEILGVDQEFIIADEIQTLKRNLDGKYNYFKSIFYTFDCIYH